MPKKSRLKRMKEWFATLFSSIGAVFYPPNVKNALKSVTKNPKEYICFYLASLVMTAGFCTVAFCTEANMHLARQAVRKEFDYHVEVALLNNEQYANLDQQLSYQLQRENEYLKSYYWVNNGRPLEDNTYTCRILLDDTYGLEKAYEEVYGDMIRRVSRDRRELRLSPLYTFEQDFRTPYTLQFWMISLLWFAFSVFMMVTLFLIRLDHFKFIYGLYMTCGADFPRLLGVAGGELMVITALTWLPGALVGGIIAGGLYIPRGVGLWLSVKGVLVPLFGGFLAVFASAWVPMRRMASRSPIHLLQAGDNTGLVSSPRRSFFLFGQSFPGKYELYGFWRMRKYYIRLVVSAVLFASFFVSGLYIAQTKTFYDQRSSYEFLVAYRPSSYYQEVTTQEGEIVGDEPWAPTPEQDAMIRSDVDMFLTELETIPGVDHAWWKVSLPGGYCQAHMLLKPGQLFNGSRYAVPSTERRSEGFQWAVNNYEYTVVDGLWIDNILRNQLGSFEGDPYAVLEDPNAVILSEDIFNEKTYDFKPGDKIILAVCEQPIPGGMTFDPQELLRWQITWFKFRYETFTVCAVVKGLESEDVITFGVGNATYTALTGRPSSRTELEIYMEPGLDMDVVRDAEGKLRGVLSPFSDWLVTPMGEYFESSIKSLKNDSVVILTLATGLLLISPMVWYFSQLLFYRKRKKEFAVLHALGAPDRTFAKLHRQAGGVLSVVAFLMTMGISLLCNYLVYVCLNTLLPRLHLTESLRYEFSLSLPALAVCLVISAVCGFLSCELSYRMFTKPDIGMRRVE